MSIYTIVAEEAYAPTLAAQFAALGPEYTGMFTSPVYREADAPVRPVFGRVSSGTLDDDLVASLDLTDPRVQVVVGVTGLTALASLGLTTWDGGDV